MPRYESNYEVPPVSRADLRNYAKSLRDGLGIKTVCFPIINLLEAMFEIGIHYDVIDDGEWDQMHGDNEHAEYNLTTHIISIKESVFVRAVNGHGRDRFTIAHEISHALLLDDKDIRVAKNRGERQSPIYKNPEWQADCLAGELLIPYHLCKNMNLLEIVEQCQVSIDAAQFQKSKF